MVKKTEARGTEATPITRNDPPDVGDSLKLRDAVATFAAGSESREKLTIADEDALNGMVELLRELRWVADHNPRTGSAAAPEIVAEITAFVTLNREVQKDQIGGVVIEMPAIENARFRSHIAKRGAELAAKIDAYIAARREFVSTKAERDREEDAVLIEAKSNSVIGAAVTAFETAYVKAIEHPTWTTTTTAVQATFRALEAMLAIAETEGAVPHDQFKARTLSETVERQRKAWKEALQEEQREERRQERQRIAAA